MIALTLASTTTTGRARGADPVPRDAQDTVVVTGTRTPERSQRATVKTDVVTRDEMDRRGATNVGEALASQPGVRVDPGAYGFLGNVSAIQIQGFDRDRVLVLEDGERVVGDIGGAIDLATLPTADLARIEIVTGPTSSLYGSSALGGVVNLVTSPPRFEGASGRARIEGRSYRTLFAQANGAYRQGKTWVTLDANVFRQDGIARIAELPDLQVPDISRQMLGLRAGTSLTKRIDLRVRARWLHDKSDGLRSEETPGLGRYLIDLPADTHRYTLHVIETIDLGRGSNLRLTLGRQWTDNETSNDRRNSPVDQLRDRHQRMQSFEAVATFADGPRTWVLGTRAEAETFSQYLTKSESVSTGVTTTRQQEVVPQSFGNAAAYGQLEWRFGKKVTLLSGVRGEGHTKYGGAVSPRLALAYRPTPEVTLRLSGGRGFRAPSAKELGFVFDHAIYGYRVLGNADLRPETSWGLNGDATWQPDKAVTLRASAFANWVEDMIDLDLANGVPNGSVVDYRYTNFGKARTLGGDLSAGVRLWDDRLRADVSYSYLWTRDDLNDRPLGGRPPHTVTSSVRALLPSKFEANARWRVTTDAFINETTRSPAYSMVDLRLGRELWPKSQAYVGVLNLLDARQDVGRVGDTRPPLGRVVYLGLRADFPWEDE
ncbi:TonB-dependent receptor [Pendulispora rubella]|uniref:TonB-dependent receptor n=1 Tax=Pendulispora rubella TaxID=2741070 RepID=A0ABZ2L0V3_9BACT